MLARKIAAGCKWNELPNFSSDSQNSQNWRQPQHSLSPEKFFSNQPKGKLYVCSVCTRYFLSASTFKEHYLTHMEDIVFPAGKDSEQSGVSSVNDEPFCSPFKESPQTCMICNDKFASNIELLIHSRSHLMKHKYGCKACGRSFFQKATLVIHCLSHNAKKRFSCKICKKSFSLKLLLSMHKRTHSSNQSLTCKRCLQTFSHKVALVEHYNELHVKKTQCEFCDKEFSNASDLRNHVLIHLEESMNENHFLCDLCGKSFPSKDLLKTHKFIHNLETGLFPCRKCERVLTSRKSLKLHEQNHKRVEVKKYSCDKCEAKFACKQTFQDHCVMHLDPDRFVCNTCGRKYMSKSTLQRHCRLEHRTDKIFSCSECPNKYGSERSLKNHVKSHVGSKPFTCNLCDKSFTGLSNLNRHRSTFHAQKKPYACSFCTKEFARRGRLLEHTRCHTGEKPFVCEICNKRFHNKTCLNQHANVHSGVRPFVCDTCGLAYAKKVALDKHIARHVGDDPSEHTYGRKNTFEKKVVALGPDQFYDKACDICGKTFFSEHSFQNHMLKHESDAVFLCHICSGEFITEEKLNKHVQRIHSKLPKKELPCSYCEKKFRDPSHLRRHEFMHTGEKLFECNLCYKRFTTKVTMFWHLKNQVCLKNSKSNKHDLSDSNE